MRLRMSVQHRLLCGSALGEAGCICRKHALALCLCGLTRTDASLSVRVKPHRQRCAAIKRRQKSQGTLPQAISQQAHCSAELLCSGHLSGMRRHVCMMADAVEQKADASTKDGCSHCAPHLPHNRRAARPPCWAAFNLRSWPEDEPLCPRPNARATPARQNSKLKPYDTMWCLDGLPQAKHGAATQLRWQIRYVTIR